MFGRSPDYMNIFITAFASAAEEFGKKDKSFTENIRGYYEHIRENDICMTHTLINPQVDRSRPVEKQDASASGSTPPACVSSAAPR
jgi:aromatic ring hydroxylase